MIINNKWFIVRLQCDRRCGHGLHLPTCAALPATTFPICLEFIYGTNQYLQLAWCRVFGLWEETGAFGNLHRYEENIQTPHRKYQDQTPESDCAIYCNTSYITCICIHNCICNVCICHLLP